jgi:hypothetical protein
MDLIKVKKDILFIAKKQNMPSLEKNNSVKFILESFGDTLSCLDVDLFKKLCNWSRLDPELPDNVKLNLSFDFINYFKDDVNWHYISTSVFLSEKFIEKFVNYVNWAMISQHQKLSEQFIEKFENKVSWSKISIGQTHLSDSFIFNHREKLNINNIIVFNKNLSWELKSKLRELRWR